MNYIFDLYGTLVDIWTDEERESLWRGVADFLGDGAEKYSDVKREYMALCKSMHKGGSHELDLTEVFEKMLIERGLDPALSGELALEFRALSTVRLQTFYGVKAMLIALKKQGRVYLVSNAQSCFTIPELKLLGLYNLFDGIVISSDLGVKKPSTEIFERAFAIFGIKKSDSIYVGNDMRDDVKGATDFGIPTLYISTPQSGAYPDIQLPSPTYVVKNHREMKRRLLEMK